MYEEFVVINYTDRIVLNYSEIIDIDLVKKYPPSAQRIVTDMDCLVIGHNNTKYSKKIELYSDNYNNNFEKIQNEIKIRM